MRTCNVQNLSFPVGFRNFSFSVLDLQHVTIVKTGGFSNKNPDTSLYMFQVDISRVILVLEHVPKMMKPEMILSC